MSAAVMPVVRGAVCLIAVALASRAIEAQQGLGRIVGTVTTEAGAPVERAQVALAALRRSTLTDRDGRFTLTDVPAGTHRITAFRLGFQPLAEEVSLPARAAVTLTLRLILDTPRLAPVNVSARRSTGELSWLPAAGDVLVGGKKNEVIDVAATPANLAENNPRQVFARVPGITVWELDGNGLQLNIASRGLNPHRSWEFLVSQNGYHVNSDLYGYPEAHYNPPMEAVDRIEIVRGTGALAFGPQFGGQVNFVLKRGDPYRRVSFETRPSVGSNGLLGTFNSLGGQLGRLNYYSFFDYRRRDGWRPNTAYDYSAAHLGFALALSPTLRLSAELSRMYYVVQFGGGLTDAQFRADPRQAPRSRNFFNPNMNIPAARLSWDVNARTNVQVVASAIVGQRNSVQFIADPTIADTINPTTGSRNPRVVDRDWYYGTTIDTRVRTTYRAFGQEQVVSGGLKLFRERTRRDQRGRGTTGSDFDLSLTSPAYPTNLEFFTSSAALFVEHAFTPVPRLLVTGGARYELVETHVRGSVDALRFDDAATRRRRDVPLLGFGATFRLADEIHMYGGWSQAFRPVLYSDLIPSGSILRVDSSLRDARGANAELGIRGRVGGALRFDVTAFELRYPNRIGTVSVGTGTAGAYLLRTNVGASLARGAEAYVDFHPRLSPGARRVDVDVYSAISYDDARYTRGSVVTGSGNAVTNTSVVGNQIEGAPEWTVRSGMTLSARGVSATVQHSVITRTFADALNTPASPNGVTGVVPGYRLLDLMLGFERNAFSLRGGVSNVGNIAYFTRRTSAYPGPGIIPSDGRTMFLSLVGRVP